MAAGLSAWQRMIAYIIVLAPAIYVGSGSVPHPVPNDLAVTFYILIGCAVGAGLFIVRRRPRDVLGWLGLLFWGGLSVIAIIGAIWDAR